MEALSIGQEHDCRHAADIFPDSCGLHHLHLRDDLARWCGLRQCHSTDRSDVATAVGRLGNLVRVSHLGESDGLIRRQFNLLMARELLVLARQRPVRRQTDFGVGVHVRRLDIDKTKMGGSDFN